MCGIPVDVCGYQLMLGKWIDVAVFHFHFSVPLLEISCWQPSARALPRCYVIKVSGKQWYVGCDSEDGHVKDVRWGTGWL